MNKYFIKSILLKSWLFQEYLRVGKALFYLYNFRFIHKSYADVKLESDYDMDKALEIEALYSKRFPKLWNECRKIYHAHQNRVLRLKRRIACMVLSSDCIFLTITFTPKVMKNTISQSRRDYIKKFLSSLNAEDYVSNIDFGDDHLYIDNNGVERQAQSREHYHALVKTSHIDYSLWKYGRINGQRVRNQTDDLSRLSVYISKLTNHAIKESTKRTCIIYKRLPKSNYKTFAELLDSDLIDLDSGEIITK